MSHNPSLPDPIGESSVFLDFQASLSAAAKVNRPILIIGERGTGKEMAARRIHYLSSRWERPLVTLNCAALSANLLEDELFGHEQGSFTGAAKRRKGRFEAADEGTLFLDEIGQTPPELQSKILRVVEYNSFERVGSSETIHVDVRIIGATNSDLLAMAHKGLFKHDLLDRLSFEVLFIPPLRARQGDIPILAEHFATRMAFELGRDEIPTISREAWKTLESHIWPGNVRELKNVIERAVYQSPDNVIRSIQINPFEYPFGTLDCAPSGAQVAGYPTPTPPPPVTPHPPQSLRDMLLCQLGKSSFKDIVQSVEVDCMKIALEKCTFNQRKAADLLGLTYHQWRGLYRKYSDVFGPDTEDGPDPEN